MANTTADKLNYLIATKNAIKQALIDKGVTVPANATFRDFATLIGTLTNTTDATATADDIAIGKTAYINGVKVTGTFDPVNSEIEEVGGSVSDAADLASEIVGDLANEIVGE